MAIRSRANYFEKGEQKVLDSSITIEEIQKTIKKCPRNKAPGPDGLTFEFYKHFEKETTIILYELFNSPLQNYNEHLGGSIISLIPKTGDLRQIKNYRPISLSNCDEKILTRILASRLQNIIGKLINQSQTGFIKGRSIFDNIHMTNNLLGFGQLDPDKYNGHLILLDQEKAYDRVDWDYMIKCLNAFGLGPKFIQYLKSIYTGATTRVNVNSVLTDKIQINNGLRQGDPLFPLLYNLVIEPLLLGLKKDLTGIQLPGANFNTIAYADDIAIGIKDSDDINIVMKWLDIHCKASNARVNIEKSIAIKVGNPQEISTKFPLVADNENFNYLGIWFNLKVLTPTIPKNSY
ncbi:Transposon TX1 uncharacterized [Zancudomyces culisetae]|uniref:Transposon TX1 uncharacterized n=1 Tax=Zancudomyces culisetae TaxID=1213189 RepID=A0A1R1PCP5_ZANCU|nr:Transposon TX1 uncharacterized [Zancudomyces culisetae]|eukprot:OMH78689.1 Transposon TX1 uncharacterized [Zancudomyces culisetae]